MKEATRVLTLLLICKACVGQFVYNYEQEEPAYPQASSGAYDPSLYQYVPPSAVQERYSQPVQPQPVQSEPALLNTETVRRRPRPKQRVQAAEVPADPQSYQQQSPEFQSSQPEVAQPPQTEVRNSRRRVHRKQRLLINQVEQPLPQKQYGPSVFQNIGLGEAPSGVHVPEDSLLNILKSNNRGAVSSHQPRHIQQAPSVQYTAPQTTAVQHYTPQVQPQQNFQNTEPFRRRSRQEVVTVEAPPNDHYSQEQPQTQYTQPEVVQPQTEVRNSRRRVHRKQRLFINQVEQPLPQRQYGPSVFQNMGLGEAPAGVHVPQDSLLNILRSNNQPRHIQQAPSVQYTAPQTTAVQHYTPQVQPQQSFHNTESFRRRPREPVVAVEAPPNNHYSQAQYTQPEVYQPQVEISHGRRSNRHLQSQQYGYPYTGNIVQLDPQRQYSRSVFENIGLGEAPAGVNVPADSFLNILRSNNHVSRSRQRRHIQAPTAQHTAPQTTAVQHYSPQILPQLSFQNTEIVRHRSKRQIPVESDAPPNDDYYYQQPQNQYDQEEEVQPQDEINYESRSNRRRQRQRSESSNRNAVQPQPQRQYSPSVFEKIALGEAPSGVHVPEDSLLNVLRSNDAGARSYQPRHVQQPPAPAAAQQYPAVRESQVYEEEPVRQAYPQTPTSVQRTHQDSTNYYAANPQPEPQQEIRRNTHRRAQQPPPRAPAARPVQAPRQQRRRDEIPQRRAPPPQTVYEVPEQNEGSNYNNDYEDDIIRRRPQNVNSRRQQQVNPSQNQRDVNEHRPSPRQQATFKPARLAIAALPDDTDNDGIPGEARVDYPTLHVIPATSFSCSEQPYNGYYADLETACQVVHMCQAGGVQSSYLCPNGTIFSQEKFSCQWWYKVNCADSPKFYSINDSLYKVPPPPSRRKDN